MTLSTFCLLPIYRYRTEEISLAKAAALAGVSWERMREILLSRGVQPRLGPETEEEAWEEIRAMEGMGLSDR
ncbi:MAG TPA: UPF0175 family protein [Anaerolineae bacterium]|nr:UPF0175 family protein [Anaerolineae bacterium]